MIGAGVGGLSCALRLAGHGVDTLVLERGTVASGASGRNGGFLLAGMAAFHNDARDLLRRATRRAASTRARSPPRRRSTRWPSGSARATRCGGSGSLRVAVSDEEAERVRGQVEALREDGFPAELVEPDGLPPVLRARPVRLPGRPRRRAASRALVPHAARCAEAAGARICEGTPVLGPVAAPGEGALETAAGARVRARHVIVAADGALPALVPDYEGRVRHAAPAHGGQRADGRADRGPARLPALGLRVLPAAPRRAHAAGRLLGPRRSGLLHRPRGGQPGGLGAPRGLPARRARPGHRPSRTAGSAGGLHRGPAAVRGRGPGPARAYGCRAATRATATCRATRRGSEIADAIAGARERSRSSWPTASACGLVDELAQLVDLLLRRSAPSGA